MKTILRVRNWDDFQHYRDRDPLWIKVYGRLLDDADFLALPEAAQAQLVKLWLMASRSRNIIHDDRAFLRFSLHTKRLYVEELVEAGFIERVPKEEATPASRADWASRHVSPEVRARVLATTGGLCAKCQGGENIEIDHVIPVSRGGSSDEANLQPLCRKCNRAKRVKMEQSATRGTPAAEQEGTPHARPRARGETERELETETETPSPPSRVTEIATAGDRWFDDPRVVAFFGAVPLTKHRAWRAIIGGWRSGERRLGTFQPSDEQLASGLVAAVTARDDGPLGEAFVAGCIRRASRVSHVDSETGRELTYLEKVAKGLIVHEEIA